MEKEREKKRNERDEKKYKNLIEKRVKEERLIVGKRGKNIEQRERYMSIERVQDNEKEREGKNTR